MDKDAAKFIVDALEFAGESAEMRDDYSGRGMYGKQTCGIVFDSIGLLVPAIVDFIKQNGIPHDTLPDFGVLRTDNMANRTIIY